jgi:glyoxylase-like metal-dependent hydrolase (beta-lactamase superfamily II)
MSTFKILVDGIAKKSDKDWIAYPNTVLIEDSGKKILVDPGMNEELLLKGMERENLSINDIDLIFLTHHHIDHILNIRLFSKTDLCDGDEFNKDGKIIIHDGKIPGTNIQVIKTPGHATEHASLVMDTDQGKVCIGGDLVWWAADKEQKITREDLLNLEDPCAVDINQLKESRKKILDQVDYIIPGHGKMFKVIK